MGRASLSSNTFLASKTVLVLLLLAAVLFVTESHGGRLKRRQRPRCIPRLCRKCELYVHSRWKRSLPLTEYWTNADTRISEMAPVASVDVDEENEEAHSDLFYKANEHPGMDSTNRALQSSMITNIDLDVKPDDESKSPRIKKRSARSHIQRCVYLLRTRCCRHFSNSIYIGYRI